MFILFKFNYILLLYSMSYLIGETSSYIINSKYRTSQIDDSARFSFEIDLPDFNNYDRVCILDAKLPHTYYQSLNYGRNGMNVFVLTSNGVEYPITVPIGNYSKQGLATVLQEIIVKIIPNSTVTFPLDVEGRQQGKLRFYFHGGNNVSMAFFNNRIKESSITDQELDAFNATLTSLSLPIITKAELASRQSDVRSRYITDLMGFNDGVYSTPNASPFLCNSLINSDLGEHMRKLLDDNTISFTKTLTTLTMVPTSAIPASIQFDNITMVTGDTVLLTGMYERQYNGVYDVTFVANTEFTLTRNANYNTDVDFTEGETFEIFTGFSYYGTLWRLNANATLNQSKRYSQVEKNVIMSAKTPHTKIPSALIIGSNLVYGLKGDYSLQTIDVGSQGDGFNDIQFQQTDILGNSKRLSNKQNKIFTFYVVSEEDEIIDFNGLDITFTLLFFQQNQVALFQLEEIKLTNIEKLNIAKKRIETEIAKKLKADEKEEKKRQTEIIKNQEEEHQNNIEKLTTQVTS